MSEKHNESRSPEGMSTQPGWLTVQEYAKRYSVSRAMLYKLAAFNLVTFKRVTLPGRTKPMVRVEDTPPKDDSHTS